MAVVLVTGGRDYFDRKIIYFALDYELNYCDGISELIHGDARGADTLAKEWAIDRGVAHKAYPVTKEDWQKHGKAAGAIRNRQMLHEGCPDLLITFPGGRGTMDMIKIAAKHGLPIKYGVELARKFIAESGS